MSHPTWELRKPDHGSTLAVPVRNLSNRALEEEECRSVYFLSNLDGGTHGHAIFTVKIKGGKILRKSGKFLEPVFQLFDTSNADVPIGYSLGATRLNHTQLYLLQHHEDLKPSSTHACTFDILTKELKPFEPPKQHKRDGLLVSAYGKLYHLAQPSWRGMQDPTFEVYDPQAGCWKSCSGFPLYRNEWSSSRIVGHAICYGCILISVEPPEIPGEARESPLWVYHVTLDEWREVKIPFNDFHYPFLGKAVVVDDTIYAESFDETVVAFSLMLNQMADGSIEYSVDKPQKLHGLRTCFRMDSDIYDRNEVFNMDPDCHSRSECLVHLGGLSFCFLQTIMKYFDKQRVFITTFDIIYKEGKRRIRTLDTTMREVDISYLGQFSLESGFTLECEEGKEIVSTTSIMQTTDDPRLCKLQQATHDKIRKQIRKRRLENGDG